MAIKAVFFDVGGTLIRPYPSVEEVFVSVARDMGYDVSLEEAFMRGHIMDEYYEEQYAHDPRLWCTRDSVYKLYITMFRLLAEELNIPKPHDELVVRVHGMFDDNRHWKLFDDVIDCLDSLKLAGYKLGVISNWSDDLAVLLGYMGIREYFDDVVSSAEVDCQKPDPRIFRLAAKRMGVTPQECVHIGDLTEADGASFNVGFHPIFFDRKNSIEYCPFDKVSSLIDAVDVCRSIK
ncbi:MAG: HAD-IA family hydrolase [Eggerthellaceae bacterium]|nr:HAD-IA family hydrolase [Eggerthellaceae bacterium]